MKITDDINLEPINAQQEEVIDAFKELYYKYLNGQMTIHEILNKLEIDE